MPRSIYGNPIESAINAFGTVSDIMEKRETAPMRRELMAQQLADERLRAEKTKGDIEFQNKQRVELERQIGRKHANEETLDQLKIMLPAKVMWDAVKEKGEIPQFSKEQRDTILKLSDKMPMFSGKNPSEVVNAIKYVNDFHGKYADKLMAGGVVNESHDPEYFKSINMLVGDQFNVGTDKFGRSVEKDGVKKRVVEFILNPQTKAVTPILEITTPVKEGEVLSLWDKDATEGSNAYIVPKGQTSITYRAPATMDHGPNPKAPVYQTPVNIINKALNDNYDFGTMLQAAMAQVDPVGEMKKMEEKERTKAEKQALSQAMSNVDTSKGVDEQRKQFIVEFSKLSPETKPSVISDFAKTLIVEKTVKQYLSRTRQVDDQKVFEESHNQGKTWTEVSKGPAFKPGKPEKRQIDIRPDAEGNLVRVDKETGKSRPVVDETTGKPTRGKKELSTSDMNLIMRKSKEVDKALEDDENVGDRKDDVSKYAETLLKANPSLGVKEVLNQAKKDLKIEKKLDKATASSILKEAGGDKNKARALAKERGYSF